jgi:phosphoglycolate phosphatase-like HAD superfamily hydrolase
LKLTKINKQPYLSTMRRFAGDLFEGMQMSSADKQAVVHAFDVDDTLTRKPDGLNNAVMTKNEFFDAARDFPPQEAVVELAQMLAAQGDRIAITTARPAERLQETIEWLRKHNVPFDQIMLSTGDEPSGVTKQAMLQKLQDDYRQVGTLIDDSPYNIAGAEMQGIPAIHVRTNDEYWEQHPEYVYPYGL